MTLYQQLQKASSEEDIKDLYIKALGLKGYQKNLIDIQTHEMWFEAKEGGRTSTYAMFTQLLYYVQDALNHGEYTPPFLCVIDSVKAAIMETSVAIPLLEKKIIKWGKSASKVSQDALDTVSQYIGTHFVSYRIETHEAEFIEAVKTAIQTGKIVRTQITPDNLKQVFDKWMKMIGCEIEGVSEEDYALLFFADVMSDGQVATHNDLPAELLHRGTHPVFTLGGKVYSLASWEGYREFWAIYDRPPKEEYRNYLLERRDSLIPLDERSFKGAYYTPLHVVDKAYDLLTQTLGNDWQREYIVWDMCCGVGNLETKHSNPRNIYMSTLDQADVDVMKATRTCVSAERFQYDYLNDDITDDGEIDYALTDKVPIKLRKAIKSGKKILVLINPPYAEATSADSASAGIDAELSKKGVKRTKFAECGMSKFGRASNELFMQFVARIAKEIPNAILAMFSTLKYVNSQTLEQFRSIWRAQYLNGVVVPSKAFDGLKGDFPIGFLIWQTQNSHRFKSGTALAEGCSESAANLESTFPDSITVEVLDKNAEPIGEKSFYNISEKRLLTTWVQRPKTNNQDALPLKNAITPATATKDLRGTHWADGAIGWLNCAGNDVQHVNNYTILFSSGFGSGRGFFVTEENLWKSAVIFTMERLIKPTWLNDRDQFLQPTGELTDEFKNDCLVWMLFNGSNLTASADGLEWNGKTWSLVNHFIPFTEDEVNATGRFESDFMVEYMTNKTFSPEARSVLDAGRNLWRTYFSQNDNKSVRDEFKLNRPDVGWYQIRNALKARNESGTAVPVSLEPFQTAYAALSEKLRPLVYELGFLR